MSHRRWRLLAAGAVLLVLVLQAWAYHGMRMDDAFITYRYAQNLAEGRGPVFNPGERVMGSTAPGHMLLSAALYRVFGQEALPTAMAVAGCVAWWTQGLAILFVLRLRFHPAVAWFTAACVWLGAVDAMNWVSLETNQVAALVLWALYAAMQGRWYVVAVLCALAGLMRPDAFLFAPLLGGWALYEQRREGLKTALVFLCVAAPWPLFATWYYGSALPQSAVAKFQRVSVPQYAHAVVEHSRAWLFLGAQGPLLWACALLTLFGGVLLVRHSWRYLPLVLYGTLHLSAYMFLLRPFTLHTWHQYPGLLVMAVCAACALGFVLLREGPWWRRGPGALVCLGLLLLFARRSWQASRAIEDAYWSGGRHKAYRGVADHLRKHAKQGDVLVALEVGTVAYYSGVHVFDLGGLVTPLPDNEDVEVATRWMMLDEAYLGLARANPLQLEQTFSAGGFTAYLFRAPGQEPFPLRLHRRQ